MSQGPYQGNNPTQSPTQSRPIKKPVSRRSSAVQGTPSYQYITATYSGRSFQEVIRDNQLGSSTQKSTDGKTGNGGKASHQTMANACAGSNDPQSYQAEIRNRAAQRIQELKKENQSSNHYKNGAVAENTKSYHQGNKSRPDQYGTHRTHGIHGTHGTHGNQDTGKTNNSAIETYMAAQKQKMLAALRGTQPPPPVATPAATSAAIPSQSHWASLRPVSDDGDDEGDGKGKNKSGKGNDARQE